MSRTQPTVYIPENEMKDFEEFKRMAAAMRMSTNAAWRVGMRMFTKHARVMLTQNDPQSWLAETIADAEKE